MLFVLVCHHGHTKIKVDGPVVEMDGDEMTRVIWTMIKDRVTKPTFLIKKLIGQHKFCLATICEQRNCYLYSNT